MRHALATSALRNSLATLAALCLAGPLAAATFAGVEVPPAPAQQPVTEVFFGE